MRILLVEDEASIATDIAASLEGTGYVVTTVSDGEEAWFRASSEEFAALVLDLGLPKLDGLSVIRRLREEGSLLPILVLTARGSWLQRVEGIDAGADDYLTKPFEMEELIARLGALLRRVGGHATPLIELGDLKIDTRRLRVLSAGSRSSCRRWSSACCAILRITAAASFRRASSQSMSTAATRPRATLSRL